MSFNLLLIDIDYNIYESIEHYKHINYLEIEIYQLTCNDIEHCVKGKDYNLAIMSDANQAAIKTISGCYNISTIVLGCSNGGNLVQSYQSGASNYIKVDDFQKIFPQIIHQYMHTFELEQEHEHKVENLMHMDSLTQLPNRSRLISDLQNEELGITSLSIVDINSFKEINDFYGHHIGDFILKSVASVMFDMANKYESLELYKFPSDTYCIANTNMPEKEFTQFNIDILHKIDTISFSYQNNEIHLRATTGISFSKKRNKLITADLALQSAKKDNKEYIVFFDQLDNLKEYQNNMLWTKKIKYALNEDNICVYFQPLVNNQTLKVEKYECLVRLIDDDKVISPYHFLEISKKSNQYSKITNIVLEKSFKTFNNLPFKFSVNISYEDIANPHFLGLIKELLVKYDVANQLIFELLEDESIKNYDILIDFISSVKSLGCKIAIDDFGSGYSNFEKLLKMEADFLKIDASLIRNITTNKNSLLITQTIIKFAKDLNLKTIAEYVENEDIYKLTKEIGVDYSQGYYFAPPLEHPTMFQAHKGL